MTVTETNGLNAAVDAALAKAKQPEKLDLDFETLTFGELCDIEDAVGVEASATLMSGKPSLKATAAAIWIVKRRADPTVTFDDVKALTIAAVEIA